MDNVIVPLVNAIIGRDGKIVGWATKWNPVGVGECIVQYADGSADSAIFAELTFLDGATAARDYLNSLER